MFLCGGDGNLSRQRLRKKRDKVEMLGFEANIGFKLFGLFIYLFFIEFESGGWVWWVVFIFNRVCHFKFYL